MKASSKTKQTLLKKLGHLRQRVADLEPRERERKQQADEILQIFAELVNITPASITVPDIDVSKSENLME